MSIWQVLTNNLRQRPRTLLFPQRVEPPPGFRGAVTFDPERCVGCGTCAYVCAPAAVRVQSDGDHYTWHYDPGRCTFCARCADVCPTRALAMEPDHPPNYERPGQLEREHVLAYPRCPQCGRPAPPVNDAVLSRAFAEISEEMRRWSQLCPDCRRRRYEPALLATGYTARSEVDGRRSEVDGR